MEEKSFSEFFDLNKEEILQEETLNEIDTGAGGAGSGPIKALMGMVASKAGAMYKRYKSAKPLKITLQDVSNMKGNFSVVNQPTYLAILEKVTNEYKKSNMGKNDGSIIKYIQDGMLLNKATGEKYFADQSVGDKIIELVKTKNPTIKKINYFNPIPTEQDNAKIAQDETDIKKEKKDSSIVGKIASKVGEIKAKAGEQNKSVNASTEHDYDMLIDDISLKDFMSIFEADGNQEQQNTDTVDGNVEQQNKTEPKPEDRPVDDKEPQLRISDVVVYTLGTDLNFLGKKIGGTPRWYLISYVVIENEKIKNQFYSFSANPAGADILEELMGTNFQNSILLFSKDGERNASRHSSLNSGDVMKYVNTKAKEYKIVPKKISKQDEIEAEQEKKKAEAIKNMDDFKLFNYLFENYSDGKFDVRLDKLYPVLKQIMTEFPNMFIDDSTGNPVTIGGETTNITDGDGLVSWVQKKFDEKKNDQLEEMFLYLFGSIQQMARDVSGAQFAKTNKETQPTQPTQPTQQQ